MLLNIAVLMLILMVTGYLATQGMLSSLLALATSIFSSILAMALLEPLQGIIGGWRPDYARGVTFLLLFFLIFSITRILGDVAVPKGIKLSVMINRIAGGTVGFFCGLVVVGSLLLGVEMLPISRAPLGFERFPGGTFMQATDDQGKPILGEVAAPHNAWFAPDRFVLAIWNGASGRSLGGARAFASVHPDLSIESYGYRNQVDGSLRTLPAALMTVKDAWKSADAILKDEQGTDHKAETGKALVMVRTQITKGDKAPNLSADEDNRLRITTSQVRLLTREGRQHYPIGYMETGRAFIPLTLDNGYLLDDYVKGDHAVEDWIFQIPVEETPAAIEIKQLARVDLTAVKDKQASPLAIAEYPEHQFFKDLSTLKVTYSPKGREIKAARVLVIRIENQHSDIPASALREAHQHMLDVDGYMKNGTNGWSEKGGPAVPPLNAILSAEHVGQNILNDPDDAAINWNGMMALLLLGQTESDGQRNINNLPRYFDDTFIPMLKSARKGSLIAAAGTLDPATGQVVIPKIGPGKHMVIFTETVAKDGTERAFFVWVKEVDFGAPKLDSKGNPVKGPDGTPELNTSTSINLSESGSDTPAFSLDLDAKP